MNKKNISFIKKNFPTLFYTITKSYIAVRALQELDRPRYWYCMLAKKPYFGTISLAGQTWEERKAYMQKLLSGEINRKKGDAIRILEVGSWAGNSAVLWADVIKKYGARGEIVCVDPWEPYVKEDREEGTINVAILIMNQALEKGDVYKLFLHNIQASGHAGIICPRKGFSDQILPTLKESAYDLIFLDGDHSYSGIKKDLQNMQRLLVDGGIVCGDDLDLQADEIDLEYAKSKKETNFIVDPKTSKEFHPGISVAVWEFFGGRISSYEGFWAMRKKGSQWEKVLISVP